MYSSPDHRVQPLCHELNHLFPTKAAKNLILVSSATPLTAGRTQVQGRSKVALSHTLSYSWGPPFSYSVPALHPLEAGCSPWSRFPLGMKPCGLRAAWILWLHLLHQSREPAGSWSRLSPISLPSWPWKRGVTVRVIIDGELCALLHGHTDASVERRRFLSCPVGGSARCAMNLLLSLSRAFPAVIPA